MLKASFKKRLNKLEKELSKPQIDCYIAMRIGEHGPIKFNGAEYKTEAALDKELVKLGITSERPVIILTQRQAKRHSLEGLTNQIYKRI